MHVFAFKRWLSLLVLLCFSCAARAWTPGLTEAAQAVAAGRATVAQELMVFINNRELNLLAQEGRLSERVYAVCQDEFFQLNNRLVNQAANQAGFGASISDAKLNPGTDTDVNVLSKSGKPLRLEDIQKIEGQYQAAIREHFLSKDPKLDVPKSRIDTNTDFMPHPDHTPPGEFRDIANHINANGGTAYTNPQAASAQAKLGSRLPLTLDEASSFGSTMKDMASAKIHKADALRKEAVGLRGADPSKAQLLEAQAAQYEYQAAKYHDRLSQLDQHLREQFKLPERSGASAVDDAAKRIGSIGRNPYSRSELGTIRSLHENALQRSTDDLIDTLLSSARKDPSRLADVRRIVTEQARSLPMSRAGQAMERLQTTVKKVEAAQKWINFKNSARKLGNVRVNISGVMTVGGAILMGQEGVRVALNDVKATDTLWDFVTNVYLHSAWEGTGVGPAFEQAQAEELARYLKEFEQGQNPDMVKHVTFTILKTGVYMGKDVLIGVLYLPDTIWEYFTQEKELEAYAAMQNDLARVMHQMVLDRRAFDDIMTRFRKLGLHDEDVVPFFNCLCRNCGGSLGGFFNPEAKGEYGHGPCQCNGPLTIWKTPLPSQDKEAQYACFNTVTKMRYDQAQDIFENWRQQALKQNADAVAPALKAIEDSIRTGEVERDEVVAHDMADKIAAIKDLLMPQDLDHLRAYVGPHLANHAARKIETGQIDRAVDDMDRVLNKIGARDPREEANFRTNLAQYQKWAETWKETQEKVLPAIAQQLQKNQVYTARGELERLEYRMLKESPRQLPYAVKDPRFLALKERAAVQQKAYNDALQVTWAESNAHQRVPDPKGALLILQKALSSWEHLPETVQGLQRQIAYNQGEIDKAERYAEQGQQAEKQGVLATAIQHYKASLASQQDAALQRHLTQLEGTLAEQQRRAVQAKQLRDEGAALQAQGKLPEAIAKYRESLKLLPDPALTQHIQTLERQLQQQQQNTAQAQQLRSEGEALQRQKQIPQAIAKYRDSLKLVPDPSLEQHIQTLERQVQADQQKAAQAQQAAAQAQRLRSEGEALQRQNRLPEAIAKYRESLVLLPDPALAQHIQILENTLNAPPVQPTPVPVPRIDPVGTWRHHPEATWKITRTANGGFFAQESGLGNASGTAQWTPEGSFRIDYKTRDGTIDGSYEVRFNADGTADGNVREFNGPRRNGATHWTRIRDDDPSTMALGAGLEGLWDTDVPGTVHVQLEILRAGSGWQIRFYGRKGWEQMADVRIDLAAGSFSFRRPLASWGESDQTYTGALNGNNLVGGMNFSSAKWTGTRARTGSATANTSQNPGEAAAKRLREEGAALQAQSKLPEAIAKYRESLTLVPDRNLEQHIQALERLLQTQASPGPTVPPPSTKPGTLLNSGNIGGVYNLPTRPTVIRLAQEIVLTSISNYHWNDGRGTPRTGSISLRDASGRSYGPWSTSGSPGQGGVPNANWTAAPNVRIPAGDYTVVDSDPATWSQNSGSGGAGHTRFEGYPTSPAPGGRVATVLPTSPTAPTSPSVATPQPAPQNLQAASFDGSYSGQFGGDGGGPIRFTVRGQNAQGQISGLIDGDKITGTLSGSVDASGRLLLNVKGLVSWRLSSGSTSGEEPFTGQLSGVINNGRISGQWSAQGADPNDKRSGSWKASR